MEEQLDEARLSWDGASYEEVVARWGAPTRSTTLPDGRETHTWITQQPPAVAGGGPSVGLGVGVGRGARTGVGVGFGFGVPIGTASGPAMCERTLTFEDNRVVDQSWLGDEAYCRHFARVS